MEFNLPLTLSWAMLVSGEQNRPSSNDLFNIISGRGGRAEGDISYGYNLFTFVFLLLICSLHEDLQRVF